MSDVLAALRSRIREIEGHAAVRPGEAPVRPAPGVEGWPSPGLVEVVGTPGSGRLRVVAEVARAAQRRGERVGWIEVAACLYPPALAALGVRLDALVVVRPPADRASWAVEELARSGCFGLVVAEAEVEGAIAARRWEIAARQGQTTLVVVGERPCALLPATLRLEVAAGEVRATARRGPSGRRPVPGWPEGFDPWGDLSGDRWKARGGAPP